MEHFGCTWFIRVSLKGVAAMKVLISHSARDERLAQAQALIHDALTEKVESDARREYAGE